MRIEQKKKKTNEINYERPKFLNLLKKIHFTDPRSLVNLRQDKSQLLQCSNITEIIKY